MSAKLGILLGQDFFFFWCKLASRQKKNVNVELSTELVPGRLIGIWKFWFLWREENRSTRRKTSRSNDENQQQTQPIYDAESDLYN